MIELGEVETLACGVGHPNATQSQLFTLEEWKGISRSTYGQTSLLTRCIMAEHGVYHVGLACRLRLATRFPDTTPIPYDSSNHSCSFIYAARPWGQAMITRSQKTPSNIVYPDVSLSCCSRTATQNVQRLLRFHLRVMTVLTNYAR